MKDEGNSEQASSATIDFDEIYRTKGTFKMGGEEYRFGSVPWDTGDAEPLLVEVERAGGVRGAVLDAGCGLGRNAIYLAQRGYSVTGIDGSQVAVEQARERARERGVSVEFLVGDATELRELQDRTFDTAVDSGLYHLLDESQRQSYVASLYRVCRPGAHLHLFGFTGLPAVGVSPFGGFGISEDGLRRAFGEGWTIRMLAPASMTAALTRDDLRRQAAGGQFPLPLDPETLQVDGQGRVLFPCLRLDAERS
jgi:SAM-dependent methyltransferase